MLAAFACCRRLSGGASAVKEPGHFEVRKSSSQVTQIHFFLKKSCPLLVAALKTQAANAVSPSKKRSDKITFLFSVHTVTEAKQYAGLGRAELGLEPGRWIFQSGHLTWRTLV